MTNRYLRQPRHFSLERSSQMSEKLVAKQPHLSIAVWPDDLYVGSNVEGKNETSDELHSKEAAEAVCRMLKRDGYGGERKVFPLSTRVEPVTL